MKHERKIILCVLVLAVMMLAMTQKAHAMTGGEGTETNPYQIANKEDLKEFAQIVNGQHDTIPKNSDAWAILTADIDMGGVTDWTPIGKENSLYNGTFSGKDDTTGQNHKISNLVISGGANYGLFGLINSDGKVLYVTIDGGSVSGSNYVGSIAGFNHGTIKNCINTATVSGASRVGGIVGQNFNIIQDCNNTGKVSGPHDTGGIVGATSSPSSILGCNNTGEITGNEQTGGVAGELASSAVVSGCSNEGKVTGTSDCVGGIVGLAKSTTSTTSISSCKNTGSVTGKTLVGGIAGKVYINITKSVNTAKISGTRYVGGITGFSSGSITYCGNTGIVEDASNDPGGIVGYNNNGTCNNCCFVIYQAGAYGLVGNCSGGTAAPTDCSIVTALSDNKGKVTRSAFIEDDKVKISLTAVAIATGQALAKWTDGNSQNPQLISTDNPYTFTPTADTTVKANFDNATYTVSLHPNEGTINSGNVASYTYGTGATLPTNVTRNNYSFAGWFDNEYLNGSPVTTIASTATGEKEYWAKWKCTITVNKTPSEAGVGGTVSGGGEYADGQSVTVTATPATGYSFIGWKKGDTTVSTNATYTFNASGNATLTAVFELTPAKAPTIATQPSNLTLTYGDGGTLTVAAAAATDTTYDPLTYEWYACDSQGTIADQASPVSTSATYPIPSDRAVGTYYYKCIVTATRTDNGQTKAATSNMATVTVNKTANPLTFTDKQTVTKDFSKTQQTATLEAAANGVGDVSYEITSQKNGDNTVDYFSLASTGSPDLTIKANTPAGDYKVMIKATAAGNGNYNSGEKTSTITVTVNKIAAVPATVTANDRDYNGIEEPLVTVTGTATGGEMQYAVVTDEDSSPGESAYKTSIPEKTKVGTYYVWYKAKGEGNYKDSQAAVVTAHINPVDKTALNEAISDAKDYYDTIKNKNEYSDIAKELDKAIKTAEETAENANVTANEVANAISKITTAEAKVKTDVKDTDIALPVIAQINALLPLDELQTSDKEAIEKAREDYENLTQDQKDKVYNIQTLKSSEAIVAALERAEQAEADKKTAEEAAAAAEKARDDAIAAKEQAEKQAALAEQAKEAAIKAKEEADKKAKDAEDAKIKAEEERDAALKAKDDAEKVQAEAEQAAADAKKAQEEAEEKQAKAEAAQAEAEKSQKAAEDAKAKAEADKKTAEELAAQAGADKEKAQQAQAKAEESQRAAEVAAAQAQADKTAAQNAQKAAETARSFAEVRATAANNARVAAEAAQKAAEERAEAAEAAQKEAEEKATAAEAAQKTAEEKAAVAQAAKEAAEEKAAAAEAAQRIAEEAAKAAKEAQAKAEADKDAAEEKADNAEKAQKEAEEKAKIAEEEAKAAQADMNKAKEAAKAAQDKEKEAQQNTLTPLAKTKNVKVKGGKRKATVRWKAVDGAKGYEILVSRNKKGTKKVKTVTVKGATKSKKIIKKLKKGKYFIKVRAWKGYKGNTVYGKYSKAKRVKVK